MLDLKTIAAGSLIAGGLGLAAIGVGTGVANAAPASPVISGPQWLADDEGGHGHGHGHGGDWGGWDGPRYWDPVQACIVAGGPFGYVQGSLCI
jgi:hypothetical protein